VQGEIDALTFSGQIGSDSFRALFDTIQSELDFEVVMNIVGLVVIYLVLKFYSHRRTFSGDTASLRRRRVAARPASAGADLCSVMHALMF
jgi:hypothetical protein